MCMLSSCIIGMIPGLMKSCFSGAAYEGTTPLNYWAGRDRKVEAFTFCERHGRGCGQKEIMAAIHHLTIPRVFYGLHPPLFDSNLSSAFPS